MPAITVSHLQKTFQSKRKAAGLGGSLRALFRPQYSRVEAVRDLSFEMEMGELLGFIGPNGAGKSTTIKILTGILYPTAGDASVLGCQPWKERTQLAYQIGTVFGQRMRCEVAASLLHKPRLLLLDEPSIGLDVVAKQLIRDAIRTMSQEEGVGVLLTSHDANDLEALCRRVIIINHGQIVYQDKVSNLKRRFLTRKRVEVRYAEEVEPNFAIPGVETIKTGQYGVKLQFDASLTPVGRVLAELTQKGSVVDITISDPPLEEVIAKIYQEEQTRANDTE